MIRNIQGKQDLHDSSNYTQSLHVVLIATSLFIPMLGAEGDVNYIWGRHTLQVDQHVWSSHVRLRVPRDEPDGHMVVGLGFHI